MSNEHSPDFVLTSERGTVGRSPERRRETADSRPSRGLRVRTDVPDLPATLAEAALAVTPQPSWLSDFAAARRWGLPLPPWIGLSKEAIPVSVAVPAGRNRPVRRGVRGRRLCLPDGHVTVLDGCALTTPGRTWLDCAPLVPLEHLVAMGDHILHVGLGTESELRSLVNWARRRRGVVNARLALDILDADAESPGESIVRTHLVVGGIPAPECNVNIIDSGRWLARADMTWRAQRLIVEYDGAVHLEDRQRKRDAARRNDLLSEGWQVLTFTSDDLRRPWRMVAQVRAELNRAAPRRVGD